MRSFAQFLLSCSTLLLSTTLVTTEPDLCPCGYSSNGAVYTELQETDFSTVTNLLGPSSGWQLQEYMIPANVSNNQPFAREPSRRNVIPTNEGVQLIVRPEADGVVSSAELVTARSDIHYGSFRVGMKGSPVSGTCAAFFWVSSEINSRCDIIENQALLTMRPLVPQRRPRNRHRDPLPRKNLYIRRRQPSHPLRRLSGIRLRCVQNQYFCTPASRLRPLCRLPRVSRRLAPRPRGLLHRRRADSHNDGKRTRRSGQAFPQPLV
jgi:hypothetical protein